MTPLQIVVSVTNSAALSIGEIRLLDFLLSDPRTHLKALVECPNTQKLPALLRLTRFLETPFSQPKSRFSAPAWQAAKDSLPVLRPGSTPPDTLETDMLIDFSGTDAAFEITPPPKQGVWRLSAFDPAAGFIEAQSGAATTRVELLRQMGADRLPELIASAQYGTKFLASRNAAFIREKSVQLIMRELARISLTGAIECVAPASKAVALPRLAQFPPYWGRALHEVARRARNLVWQKRGLRPGAFQVWVGQGTPLDFDPGSATPVALPKNSFQADPFFFRKDGQLFLFVEEFDYDRGLGHISVSRVTGTRIETIGAALKTPYHLSYPLVFSHAGEILMMPETNQSGRLEIWRATDFPQRWELKSTALEGQSPADSVLFQRNGQWWLFTNICRDSFGDMCSELHLFQVDGPSLTGLKPHPLNPVVIDSTSARGGGRVFQRGNHLYRASQNNSAGTYGYGLNIMEITRLDMRDYRETPVRRIAPDFAPGLIGCHHVDFDGPLFAIDVRWSKL